MVSMGCIGSLVAPQINLLAELFWKPLSYVVFSVLSIVSSSFVVLLIKTQRKTDDLNTTQEPIIIEELDSTTHI